VFCLSEHFSLRAAFYLQLVAPDSRRNFKLQHHCPPNREETGLYRAKSEKMKQLHVDMNCDLGEGIGNDAAVMPYISSANIACGYHAGDEQTMRQTIRLAKSYGVAIGAHPGYDDKANFGRTSMNLPEAEVEGLVRIQIERLMRLAAEEGCRVGHVKPHGALYNQAATNPELANAIAHAIAKADRRLRFVGLANSAMEDAAKAQGLTFVAEVFADRAYTDAGLLVSRQEPGAVIHDAEVCARRVTQMVTTNQVESISGKLVPIKADSICVHGDNPEAVLLVQTIHEALSKQHIAIKSAAL